MHKNDQTKPKIIWLVIYLYHVVVIYMYIYIYILGLGPVTGVLFCSVFTHVYAAKFTPEDVFDVYIYI